jgi:hypothetical protein
LFLKKDESTEVAHAKLADILLKSWSEENLDCLINTLNHSKDIEVVDKVNNYFLKQITGASWKVYIPILSQFYQNVGMFKECITPSAPYFALIVDSGDKEMRRMAAELMATIERCTGMSPFPS